MNLTFRQGVARYQTDVYATPTFLQKSGQYIDLIVSPDPTIVIFAHKGATYVVEEAKTVHNAWGPFTDSTTKYLYWDINLLDASLTRGVTSLPQIVGGIAPSSPAVDQHWFDTTSNQMKVWNGNKWLDKVRVFAATYSSSAIIQPFPLGTQAGLTGDFEAGNLVLDAYNKPLRQSDGTFVTSVTLLSVINAATIRVKFETEIYSGMADEYIPKFSFVQVNPNRRIRLARSDEWKSRIAGLVVEDLYQSEVGYVETDGLVRYEQWNFTNDQVGRPVFCGPTGEVTLTPPFEGVSQIAGYVYDKDAIYLNIQPAVILDDLTAENLPGLPPPALPPVSDFVGSPSSGTSPLTVNFTSTSLHNPTTFAWDFENDGTVDATTEVATYTFSDVGSHDVKLTTTNAYGSNTVIKQAYVNVAATPVDPTTMTNLGVQLSGPLQVNYGQTFAMTMITTNDGNLGATNVVRTIYIDDVNGVPISVAGLPAGTTTSHAGTVTTISLPNVGVLSTGQNVVVNFAVTAPSVTTNLTLRSEVSSPETDSTSGDNTTTLTIRVKP